MEGLIALGGLTTLFVANESQKKKTLKKEPKKNKFTRCNRVCKGFPCDFKIFFEKVSPIGLLNFSLTEAIL